MRPRIAILGAGSWGSALAVHLTRIGHDVRLWARDAALATELVSAHQNARYLPGVVFPSAVLPTHSLSKALAGAAMVVVTVPSHGMRAVVRNARSVIEAGSIVVSGVKGLEVGSMRRMSEVIGEELPGIESVVVLSGPSFAVELANELPTAIVVASSSASAMDRVQAEFRSSSLRLYGSSDVIGVEMGGALKNIIAIAAGVVEGLGLGHNAMAALITRGLVEITRLAVSLGAQRDTLSGLAGLGDLVLTCTGELSRNRHVGIQLGLGRSLDDILSSSSMVAEGVRTTEAALALGAHHRIELPIAEQMAEVLSGRKDPQSAIRDLMSRRQKQELA
ncbi:MAG: NAD(P)H-dependent glycerol-3-phosphate dehydrogenase [Vicinamibacterales bacterium]